MERMLITKLVRTENARAELYAPRHQWPDLKLFDLGLLATVGMKPAELPIGVEVPCMFYAVWEYSENLNQNGNPYKDIVSLEPAETVQTYDPLRDIAAQWQYTNTLFRLWLKAQSIEAPEVPEIGTPTPQVQTVEDNRTETAPPSTEGTSNALLYEDGTKVGDNDAEKAAFNLYGQSHHGAVPANVDALRVWFNENQEGQAS